MRERCFKVQIVKGCKRCLSFFITDKMLLTYKHVQFVMTWGEGADEKEFATWKNHNKRNHRKKSPSQNKHTTLASYSENFHQ